MMKRLPNDCFFSLVEDDIHHGKSVRFRMKGSSMFPLLREGKDEVAVYLCKAESLKPMDVVGNGLSGFRTCRVGFFFALAYLEPFMAKLGSFQESRFVYFSSYSVLINMLLCLLLLLKVFT